MGRVYIPDYDILDLFWNETRARDGAGMEHYKSNAIWFYLSNIKDEGSEVYRSGKLTRVFQDVLVLPRSNVELERLFNVVKPD